MTAVEVKEHQYGILNMFTVRKAVNHAICATEAKMQPEDYDKIFEHKASF